MKTIIQELMELIERNSYDTSDGNIGSCQTFVIRCDQLKRLIKRHEALQSAQEAKPVAWWNGLLAYDSISGPFPSFSLMEDEYCKIPLYASPQPEHAQASLDAKDAVMSAVENFIKVKGRYHTEQAVIRLHDAYNAAIDKASKA
jgi:hypothetical protein